MNLSYWEIKNWFTGVDYTIIGSGIVGLHAALRLREKFPDSNILILENGPLPQVYMFRKPFRNYRRSEKSY